jgi:hypothetical protein
MTFPVSVVFHKPSAFVVSPMVYLHRRGPTILEDLAAALPRMETGNVAYACARFIGYCHNQIEGTQLLGVDNLWQWGERGTPLDKVYEQVIADLRGDSEFVLVNVETWEVECQGKVIGRLSMAPGGQPTGVPGETVRAGECLALDSPRWAELWHMYGDAHDVPDRLRALEQIQNDEELGRALFQLMVGISHQSDVTTAAYAVVPHFRRLCLASKLSTRFRYLGCIAEIEEARHYHEELGNEDAIVPEDLAPAYFAALNDLPGLIAECYNHRQGSWC